VGGGNQLSNGAEVAAENVAATRSREVALARAAGQGDEASIEEIVRATQGSVWRFCRHILGDDDDAYDATQETFLRALSSLRTYRGESTLLTWLLSIARRVCGRQIRQRIRARGRERRWEIEPAVAAPDPSLQLALDSLPSDLREALVLTQIVGLTYEETASAMECAVGTVRSRVFRARQRLMDLLR
jgi:RNA polymerase sigma-70 factor (ECF subfamily)